MTNELKIIKQTIHLCIPGMWCFWEASNVLLHTVST